MLDISGIVIRDLRKKQNMTQRELAELAAVDESMINKIENGHSVGSVQTLTRIAAALGVGFHELIVERSHE